MWSSHLHSLFCPVAVSQIVLIVHSVGSLEGHRWDIYKVSLDLGLPDLFSWLHGGFWFSERMPRRWSVFCVTSGEPWYPLGITGNVHLPHLVKRVSARMLHRKLTFSLFQVHSRKHFHLKRLRFSTKLLFTYLFSLYKSLKHSAFFQEKGKGKLIWILSRNLAIRSHLFNKYFLNIKI